MNGEDRERDRANRRMAEACEWRKRGIEKTERWRKSMNEGRGKQSKQKG